MCINTIIKPKSEEVDGYSQQSQNANMVQCYKNLFCLWSYRFLHLFPSTCWWCYQCAKWNKFKPALCLWMPETTTVKNNILTKEILVRGAWSNKIEDVGGNSSELKVTLYLDLTIYFLYFSFAMNLLGYFFIRINMKT